MQFFHRSPFTIHIAEWLMNQIQVEVIQLQSLQRSFKGSFCSFITIPLNPKLGGNKQFFSFHTASFDSSANRFFVLIRSGGINVAISDLDSVDDASFTFGQISYLKNAKTENGNFNATVQS